MSKITIIWPASILRRAFKNRLVTEAEEPTPSAISVRRDAVHRAEPRTDSSSHLCGRWFSGGIWPPAHSSLMKSPHAAAGLAD